MKQGPYRSRRGKLHRHGGTRKRPKNRPVSLKAKIRRKVQEIS